MSDPIGIVGIDGYTPIYQPDARWTIWSIHDIYMGSIGKNKYIPKVNDYVLEPETGSVYIVIKLDEVTFVPELAPVRLNTQENIDIFISSTLDNYRIYYDKSVTPYTLAVDALLKIYSSTAKFARIYKGTFLNDENIISRIYDNSGNFLGHDIRLEVVAYNSHDNYAIKSVPSCNTNANLKTGDICTVVVFDDNSKVITKVTCIVEETTYVAPAFAEQKYVINIALKTPFLNPSNDNQIDYPVNLPLYSFHPIAAVYYNDGSSIEYAVDGDKFRLYGLDQFISTIIGHRVPLVLSYRLDPDEAAITGLSVENNFVTRPYTLVVSNPNTTYNVKLFVYPEWIDTLNGYRLKAYLMNLDRNVLFDVTGNFYLSSNSPSFNPVNYGVVQRLILNIDLSKVSSIYGQFIHTQTVDIVLRGPANDSSIKNIWEVGTEVPSSVKYYGTNLRAIKNLSRPRVIKIDHGMNSVAEFLENVYKPTLPLYNPITEVGPLTPTHIKVRYMGEEIVKRIEEFNTEFEFSQEVTLYKNVDIIFMKEYINQYLYLSIANMTVR